MRPRWVDPGRLRERLTVETPTRVADGIGGHTLEWSALATVAALVEPVGARERPGAGQALPAVTHEIIIRHRADVASGMRLVKDGRVFAVVTVHDPDESGRFLLCKAVEEGR